MSIWNVTVEDLRRVFAASAGLFNDKGPTLHELKKLVKAADDNSASGLFDEGFVNPGPVLEGDLRNIALRLRTALAKAHGQKYVDDLWERIRK